MNSKKNFSLIVVFIIITSVKAQNPTDFKFISATDGSQFVLSDAKGKFVALHFLLKTECPNCIRHTNDYLSKAGTLPNVIQIFIKPDTDEEISKWETRLSPDEKIVIPVYRDPGAELAKKFMIPNGYFFHNQLVHYPALILLGPDGKEVFRYIGKDNTDRYSFEQFTAKIHELNEK
jgi:peroxiredoxin Q/BCP